MLNPPPNIDQSLVAAYEQTHYCLPGLGAIVQVGTTCPLLDQWLRTRRLPGGAFVTAYNPKSNAHTAAENTYWQDTLESELADWQQPFLPAIHRDPTGKWHAERACFILGMEAAQAVLLGKRFQQNAILGYQLTMGAKLWWC